MQGWHSDGPFGSNQKNQIGGGAKKGQKKCTGGMFL